ncbi:Chorismate--pyruvate lyase [hydrothermal vent metagenome]|uniref:Chorismate--pyruvate lyase n=1 Tax=hydrothermal vent metagenome TaxID=652676 RepID=A0A3B1BNE1_9ZZZZ
MVSWLFDRGSLTRRLQLACPDQFQVQLLEQSWQRPMLNEAMRLGVSSDRMALVRQVYLLCQGRPVVYARTVIPISTLSGAERHLACLGNRPLGAVLFADPNMSRDEVEVACIGSGQRVFTRAVQALDSTPVSIWGRRSVFYLSAKPLLVNEVFLPGISDCNTRSEVAESSL